jgi:hypothetical protein
MIGPRTRWSRYRAHPVPVHRPHVHPTRCHPVAARHLRSGARLLPTACESGSWAACIFERCVHPGALAAQVLLMIWYAQSRTPTSRASPARPGARLSYPGGGREVTLAGRHDGPYLLACFAQQRGQRVEDTPPAPPPSAWRPAAGGFTSITGPSPRGGARARGRELRHARESSLRPDLRGLLDASGGAGAGLA